MVLIDFGVKIFIGQRRDVTPFSAHTNKGAERSAFVGAVVTMTTGSGEFDPFRRTSTS